MNETTGNFNWAEVEPLCLLKLLLYKAWLLVLAFLIGSMGVSVVLGNLVSRSYSCSATFAVAARSGTSSYYSSTSAASEVAAVYSELMQGRFMDELIFSDLGSVDGSIKATQLGDTNLISLTVTSSSPKDALLIMQSIMENYQNLSDYISSNAVLNPLNTPNISINVNRPYNVSKISKTMGLVCAAAMACAICYLSLSRGTIQTMEGAKNRLDGKIIASIPHEKPRRSRKSLTHKKGRRDLHISSTAISFAFAESIHSIASKLEHEHAKGKTVFLFSSVSEGEGKSTIAANSALSLAAAHSSVLFIDLDLRRPVQADFLNVKLSKKGAFGDLLLSGASARDILASTAIDPATGMEMLLSNRSYTDMIDLITSPLLAQVIGLAREKYDYVIIDSPPLGYFADSEVLSDLSDGTVLVIRQDVAPAAEINDAIDSLRACKAEFLGCVLNDMQHLSPRLSGGRYGYGYGYGKYGKYGHSSNK